MKKEELKFKCVVPTEEDFHLIRAKLFGAPSYGESYIFMTYSGETRSEVVTNSAEIFCGKKEPLMTYEEALELIAQVEPEQKGEWVECELDERGFYRIVSDGIIYAKNWQDTYIAPPLIFGGWLWGRKNGKSFWSCDRFGVDSDGDTIAFVHDWVKPLTPKKIKFWRVK